MSDPNTWELPWSMMSQVRLEIESELRNQISRDIEEYIGICKDRGLSSYFTNGLHVAASIAVNGLPKPEGQMEEML